MLTHSSWFNLFWCVYRYLNLCKIPYIGRHMGRDTDGEKNHTIEYFTYKIMYNIDTL